MIADDRSHQGPAGRYLALGNTETCGEADRPFIAASYPLVNLGHGDIDLTLRSNVVLLVSEAWFASSTVQILKFYMNPVARPIFQLINAAHVTV